MHLQTWLIVGIVLLNAYSLGANCVERFVNYQTWPLLAQSNFAAYHRAQQPFILGFVVAPTAFLLVLQILFFFDRPAEIAAGIAWGMVAASGVGALSTIFIQLPLHRQLNARGYSGPLIRTLMRTDWIRKAADVARIILTAVLLERLLHL